MVLSTQVRAPGLNPHRWTCVRQFVWPFEQLSFQSGDALFQLFPFLMVLIPFESSLQQRRGRQRIFQTVIRLPDQQ